MSNDAVIPLSNKIESRFFKIKSLSCMISEEEIFNDDGNSDKIATYLSISDIYKIASCDKICYYLTNPIFSWSGSCNASYNFNCKNVNFFLEECERSFNRGFVFALLSLEPSRNESIIMRGNFIKMLDGFEIPKLESRCDIIDKILKK